MKLINFVHSNVSWHLFAENHTNSVQQNFHYLGPRVLYPDWVIHSALNKLVTEPNVLFPAQLSKVIVSVGCLLNFHLRQQLNHFLCCYDSERFALGVS